MVYIVTGGRDRGKTATMAALYEKSGRGDGIITAKVFNDGQCAGYELVRLSTRARVPLAVRADAVEAGWDECCRQGRYSFSKRAFAYATDAFEEMLARKEIPIFIDEVGPLELAGGGFASVANVLAYADEVYIAVRDTYFTRVIERYGVGTYRVIPAGDSGDFAHHTGGLHD